MEIYHKSIPYSNKILAERIKGGRLLDVGGAECPSRINLLADNADEIVLLDLKEPWGELEKNVSFLKMPVEDLSPENGLFYHILLSNILEHLDDPLKALKKCIGVLAQNGNIHILSPNCESLNRRIGVKMGMLESIKTIPEKEIAIGHKHALSVGDVKGFIKDSGLELVECVGVFLKPVPTAEMLLWPEERLRAFFEIGPEIPPELCHEVYFRAVRNK